MQFLQQSITNKNSFCECHNDKATHFRDVSDGRIRPVAELDLVANSQITRLFKTMNTNLPEPLLMPTMNKNLEDEQIVIGNVLPLPSMRFDKRGKKDNKAQTASNHLPLPSLVA